MSAPTSMTFRRLDEEPTEEREEAGGAGAELGARFWFAFDRWLAVASPSTEEEFVFA